MRILEITLLVVITILPFTKRLILKFITKKVLICVLCTILTLHLLIEGWRWQLLPAYIIVFILIFRIFSIDSTKTFKLTFLKVVGYTSILFLTFLSWLLPNVLPVFSLPKPSGEYTVGTRSIHLETNINEAITKDPNDKRELMIKVWYPSSDASGKQDPYLDQANRTSFINKYLSGMPKTTLNYLNYVDTHIYKDATISDGTFPILIFSHGYGSNASGYYALLSEIASHGYIILNMNHTYESLGSAFPNGRKAYFNYEYQASNNANSMKHIAPIKDAFANKNLSYDERHTIIREASKNYVVTNMVKRWTTDIIYTIDQLETWNTKGFLKDKLDLNKIGVFGHSRGGGAAGQVTIKDSRIKAAANIDGVQWGEMMDTIYQKPFLYISADWPKDHEDINSHIYKHKSTNFFYESKLLTSAHPNFMDIPFMIPVRKLAQTGAINPELGIKITNELVTKFFDKHLKNNDSISLVNISKKYKLLEMVVHKGDSVP